MGTQPFHASILSTSTTIGRHLCNGLQKLDFLPLQRFCEVNLVGFSFVHTLPLILVSRLSVLLHRRSRIFHLNVYRIGCGCYFVVWLCRKVNGVSSASLRSCCLIRVVYRLSAGLPATSVRKSVILNIFCRQRTVAYTSMRAGRMDVAIFIINTVYCNGRHTGSHSQI